MRFVSGHNRRRQWWVERRGDCWEVHGVAPSRGGYAHMRHAGRKVYAHCLFYEVFVGPVLDGLELDHLCRNPLCVNPGHLEPVTGAVNSQRGASTKLTPAEVVEIRKAPGTLAEIAAQYGISPTNVSTIRRRRTWRNLP